jgi:Ca2+-binding RTX toxin-like protein
MAFDDDIRDLGSADTINAGAGDDLISGGDGNDTLNREDGSDTFAYTLGQGADTVQGGPGADTLNISGTTGHNVLDMMYDETVLTTFEDGTLTQVEAVTADPRGGTDTLSYIETSSAVTAA